MSIQSEITRLSGAKSDIATAIAAKGVTVPSGTKLDGMAQLIMQIPAGTGSITVVESQDSHGGTIVTITTDDSVSEAAGVSF